MADETTGTPTAPPAPPQAEPDPGILHGLATSIGIDPEAVKSAAKAIWSNPVEAARTIGGAQMDEFVDAAQHPVKTARLALNGVISSITNPEAQATAKARFNTPGFQNKIHGVGEYITSGIPLVGGGYAKAEEQGAQGHVGEALGTIAGTTLPMLAGEAEGIPEKVTDTIHEAGAKARENMAAKADVAAKNQEARIAEAKTGKVITIQPDNRTLAAAPDPDKFAAQGGKLVGPNAPETAQAAAPTEWQPPANIEKGIPSDKPVDTQIPLEKLSVSPNAYSRASSDISRGRGSKTNEPIRVLYNPDNGQYLIEDGMHRVVEAHQKGETSIPAKLWSGYSDTTANVHGEKMDLSPEQPEADPVEDLIMSDKIGGKKVKGATPKVEPTVLAQRAPEAPKGLVERTTGDEQADAAIKSAGAIPAGTSLGMALFHDPKTGSTLAFKPGTKITPEAVQAHLAESRQAFGIKPEPEAFAAQGGKMVGQQPTAAPTLGDHQPLSKALAEKHGTTSDPLATGFILSDGRRVPIDVDHALAVAGVSNNPDLRNPGAAANHMRDFISDEQAVRTRYRTGRGGNEIVFSVSPNGVTPEQVTEMRKAVGKMGRTGNVVMERADVNADNIDEASQKKEFASPSDIEPMLKKMGVHPDQQDIVSKELQTPHKETYGMEVTSYSAGTSQKVKVDAHSAKEALAKIKKQFPDAEEWRLDTMPEERAPSTTYSVPTGKRIKMPASGDRPEDHTEQHEMAHGLITLQEGLETGGILSSHHPDVPSDARAAHLTVRVPRGLDGRIRTDKALSVAKSILAGIAQDEINGTHRAANHNLPLDAGGDGASAYNILKAAGYTHEDAIAKMHALIDQNVADLSHPAMASVIKENTGFREKGLSRQFHHSPERLQNMHAEIERRKSNGKETGISNAAPTREGDGSGNTETVARGEGEPTTADKREPGEEGKITNGETTRLDNGPSDAATAEGRSGDVTGGEGGISPADKGFAPEGEEGIVSEEKISPKNQDWVDTAKWEENPNTGYRRLVLRDESGKQVGRIAHDNYRIRLSELDDQYTNKGVGKALYERAFADAKQNGVKELMSDTSLSPDAARVWDSLAKSDKYNITAEPSKEVNRGKVGNAYDNLHTQYTVHFDQPKDIVSEDKLDKSAKGMVSTLADALNDPESNYQIAKTRPERVAEIRSRMDANSRTGKNRYEGLTQDEANIIGFDAQNHMEKIRGAITKGGAEFAGGPLADGRWNIQDPETGQYLTVDANVTPAKIKAALASVKSGQQMQKPDGSWVTIPDNLLSEEKVKKTPGVTPELAQKIVDAHVANGGSTFNLTHGDLAGTDNYAVATNPERGQTLDHPPTAKDIQNFATKNQDLLQNPDKSLGTWHNTANDTHALDVVSTLKNKDKAVALGKKNNQIAIFHLGTNTEIPTGGTGITPLEPSTGGTPDAPAAPPMPKESAKLPIISSRIPSKTVKGETIEEHTNGALTSDMQAAAAAPGFLQKLADRVAPTPGFKNPGGDATAQTNAYIRHTADNIKFVQGKLTPEEIARDSQWYPVGAHERGIEVAKQHKVTPHQAYAVTAALSPLTDWDVNTSLAERAINIWQNQQNTKFTPEMKAAGQEIASIPAMKKFAKIYKSLEGKTLGELKNVSDQAHWLRLYDEGHNPREYQTWNPDGTSNGLAKNMDGSPKQVSWSFQNLIQNAIHILKDGSQENISKVLGGAHKVRNFYNNQLAPNDPRFLTIDTHAVAVGQLRPMSGKTYEVRMNFGGTSNKAYGLKGTYSLHDAAYRLAAKELDIPIPSRLQSSTWTKIREVFPNRFKTAENQAAVDAIWKEHTDGKITADEARDKIWSYAEGWNGRTTGEVRDSGDQRELFDAGVRGETPSGTAGWGDRNNAPEESSTPLEEGDTDFNFGANAKPVEARSRTNRTSATQRAKNDAMARGIAALINSGKKK